MKKLFIHSILAALVLFSVYCRPKKTQLDVLPIGGEFTLTDHNGKKFHLSDLKGNIVLLFFGYTHCPDACPMTMGLLGATYDRLEDRAEQVKTVFVTVDPERDDLENMKGYVEGFSETFPTFAPIGLTGTTEEVKDVLKLFKVISMKRSGLSKAGYTMDHTTSIFVFDPQGRVRYMYNPEERVDKLVHIITNIQEEG